MKHKRLKFLVLIIGVNIMIFHFILEEVWPANYSLKIENSSITLNGDERMDDDLSLRCEIPSHDPYDPTIKRFIKELPPLNCHETQPALLKFHKDVLWFDEEVLKKLGTSPEDYRCQYFEIIRRSNPPLEIDTHVDIGPGNDLEHPVVIMKDYVRVNCSQGSKIVYFSTLLKVTQPSEYLWKRALPSNKNHPSIFILGFDSTSRLNFIRQMERTEKFMRETLKGVYLTGLVKSGDNTDFEPQMGIFLTGLYATKIQAHHAPKLSELENRFGFWDDFPFVWKAFLLNGYVTMLSEDAKRLMPTGGFENQPTDYYCRPFFTAMETLFGHDYNNQCFGGIPKHKYFLPYFEEFVSIFRKKRYFSYNFISDYSHENINTLQYLDEDVHKMLSNMHNSGALENTIVVLLSDHGSRFDEIRLTDIGRYEEQMPLFLISLSENLKREYPHLQTGLENNSATLVSWFDMYELLVDVVTGNFGRTSKEERHGFMGLSPFRTIPNRRTCFEIGIPLEYCICNTAKVTVKITENVNLNVEALLKFLNSILPSECAQLRLRKILSAEIISGSTFDEMFGEMYRLVIIVNPSGAIFEGYVLNNPWIRSVIGRVSRLNRYGNQSYCIDDITLKKYCFCKDLSVYKVTRKITKYSTFSNS